METSVRTELIPALNLPEQEEIFPMQEQAIRMILFRRERSAADVLSERAAEAGSVINTPIFIP